MCLIRCHRCHGFHTYGLISHIWELNHVIIFHTHLLVCHIFHNHVIYAHWWMCNGLRSYFMKSFHLVLEFYPSFVTIFPSFIILRFKWEWIKHWYIFMKVSSVEEKKAKDWRGFEHQIGAYGKDLMWNLIPWEFDWRWIY